MTIRLAFFKLNVADMDAALAFWSAGFGFAIAQTFDEPEFLEHILALPGQEDGPNLLLVRFNDGETSRLVPATALSDSRSTTSKRRTSRRWPQAPNA